MLWDHRGAGSKPRVLPESQLVFTAGSGKCYQRKGIPGRGTGRAPAFDSAVQAHKGPGGVEVGDGVSVPWPVPAAGRLQGNAGDFDFQPGGEP